MALDAAKYTPEVLRSLSRAALRDALFELADACMAEDELAHEARIRGEQHPGRSQELTEACRHARAEREERERKGGKILKEPKARVPTPERA